MAKQYHDKHTLDLFNDWTPPKYAAELPEETTRGGTLDTQIARAISHALSQSNMSREELAKAMSDYLGVEVTRNMLDAYSSQARTDHKITLERFIALIEVTQNIGLTGFVAGFFGHIVVPSKYRELIDLHYIQEKRDELEARERAIALKWGVKR